MRVLVLNCGSSSLKFELVNIDGAGHVPVRTQRSPRGSVDGIGANATLSITDDAGSRQDTASVPDHTTALRLVFERLHLADRPRTIDAIGHRVVHGGDRFTAATRIDASMLADLEALNDLAPLHNPVSLQAIKAARLAGGAALPMVAVFDTAFYRALPEHATAYAIPADLAKRYGIRRYGFHGIAHQYLSSRYAEIAGTADASARLITLHLGSGCSVSAIRDGQPLDTSMGFTPLEGLVMSTRCGDIDPAAITYLLRHAGMSADALDDCLNHHAGLLGVSGRSADMRELVEAMATDAAAGLAVELFCYRASKYVGAYLTVLGGADAVIFSGGVGEHSAPVRARICERLRWCGLVLDAKRNAVTVGTEGRISSDTGLLAHVIPADEALHIARETARCLNG